VNPPERNRFQGIGRKIVILVLLAGLVAGFIFGQRGLLQWDKLRQRVREMELQNDSLEQEISVLAARLRALESADSLELERAARRWGMARPGEEVYIIKGEKRDSLAQD
jgi:cell division protein FtsB